MAVKVAARAGCCSMDAPEKSLHQWCSRILGFKSSVFISWYNPVQSTNFWIFLSYFLENPPQVAKRREKRPQIAKACGLEAEQKAELEDMADDVFHLKGRLGSDVPGSHHWEIPIAKYWGFIDFFLLMFREGGENYGDGMRMEL